MPAGLRSDRPENAPAWNCHRFTLDHTLVHIVATRSVQGF